MVMWESQGRGPTYMGNSNKSVVIVSSPFAVNYGCELPLQLPHCRLSSRLPRALPRALPSSRPSSILPTFFPFIPLPPDALPNCRWHSRYYVYTGVHSLMAVCQSPISVSQGHPADPPDPAYWYSIGALLIRSLLSTVATVPTDSSLLFVHPSSSCALPPACVLLMDRVLCLIGPRYVLVRPELTGKRPMKRIIPE